jgi:hypothetical protein
VRATYQIVLTSGNAVRAKAARLSKDPCNHIPKAKADKGTQSGDESLSPINQLHYMWLNYQRGRNQLLMKGITSEMSQNAGREKGSPR